MPTKADAAYSPLTLLLLLVLLLSCCACASGGDGGLQAGGPAVPAAAPGGAVSLPAPAEALRLSSDIGDDDRSCDGNEWDSALPSENVSGGLFYPSYDGTGSLSLEQCALAVYRLGELAGHNGPPRIELGFDPSSYALPDSGHLRIALANFDSGRWDWFGCVSHSSYVFYEAYQFNFGSFAPYLSDGGEMLCAVVLDQQGESELSWVLAGANAPPEVYVSTDLSNDPLENIGPLNVSFSLWPDTYGGPMAGMDIDWEGDGTYDLLGITETSIQHEYQPGSYSFTVRLTDSSGLSDIESRDFIIIDPNNTLPQAAIDSDLLGGSAPLSVNFDASGSTDDKPLSRYLWDLDSDGEFEAETAEPQFTATLAQYGPNLVTLRVIDSDLAWDESSTIINVLDGWEDMTVADANPARFEALTCGLGLGRRPCVLWIQGAMRELYFARAASADAKTWDAPVQLANLNTATIHDICAVEDTVNNRPLVAWTVYDSSAGVMQLWSRYANDNACTSWSAALLLHEAPYIDGSPALAVSGNKPRLVFATREQTGQPVDIHILLSQDSKGSAWGADQLIASAVDIRPSRMEMLSDGSDLVLAVSGIDAAGNWDSGRVMVWNSSAGDPLNWSAAPRVLTQPSSDLSLAYLDGLPALAAGGGSEHSALSCWRSMDALGAAWPAQADELGQGTECELCFWDGAAGVFFNDTVLDQISFRRLDPVTGIWGSAEIVARDTFFVDDLSVTMNLGRPFIFYIDPDEGELRCSSWHY